MAYIDEAFYLEYFGLSEAPEGFAVMEARASAIIDELTMNKIGQAGGIDLLPEFVKGKVKNSVAEIVNSIDLNGGTEALSGADFVSAGIGKFNYTAKQPDDSLTIGGIVIPQLVLLYLSPTGLMYRGI